MATSEFCSSLSQSFPLPCGPLRVQVEPIMEDENKQDCDTFVNLDEHPMYESVEENSVLASDDDDEHEDDSQKILRRFREKLEEREHIMYKKLRLKFKRNGTMERKFRETLHDFKESSSVSDLFENPSRSESRGIDIGDILSSNQGGMEEPKLERFKVKAVNIVGVGVVKEENY